MLGYFGGAQTLYAADAGQLKAAGLPKEKVEKILLRRTPDYPEKLAQFCLREKAELLSCEDINYPEKLRAIFDPPVVLYIRGNFVAGKISKSIGVVGSRKATGYGIRVACEFAQALAKANTAVISGGARGIDTAAHQGALKAGGVTIAVLGSGIDVPYPYQNKELFAEIAANGAVVTEYPPGTKPLAFNFPRRNRIISGLSDGVLVVEAAQGSGALITAEFALDEGRELYAVPGSIYAPGSYGPHSLIKQGAIPVDCAEDIFNDLYLTGQEKKAAVRQISLFQPSREETLILATLDRNCAKTPDEVVVATHLPVNTVNTLLLTLEMSGTVSAVGGHKYLKL